ncbi:paired small multidrug resistance pump [Gracilibacillus ureilyticus]|uniref:Paired small multidrug resistance pump n=1 Tax=Gracilibacillus ureilyticus TaxID=531814 RepID=A0A1H9R3Q6_9BACI|nr:multidrug efflux SMR transporter [Gracilibacillus ureilyticus]SER67481.1 paired small multidrug resistance pump [Gracilibacillus ureilyticus]
MEWFVLIASGLFEMAGVIMINRWHVTKKWRELIIMILFFGLSFLGLSYALTYIAMGTAYAIWTGIGAAGGAVVGILFFNEPGNFKRIFFLSLIILSVIGLKLVG